MYQTNFDRQGFLPALYIRDESDTRPLGEYGRSLLQNLRENNPDRYWQLSLEGTLMRTVHAREDELKEKKLLLIAELERRFPRPHTDSIAAISNHMGMLSEQAEAVIQEDLKQPF